MGRGEYLELRGTTWQEGGYKYVTRSGMIYAVRRREEECIQSFGVKFWKQETVCKM